MKEIENIEHTLCIVVLTAIAQLPKNFGYNKLIEWLKWSDSPFIVANTLQESEFYGFFSSFEKISLRMIIEYLHTKNLLETEKIGIFNLDTIVISAYWLSVLKWTKYIRLNSGLFTKKNPEAKKRKLEDKINVLQEKLNNLGKAEETTMNIVRKIIENRKKHPKDNNIWNNSNKLENNYMKIVKAKYHNAYMPRDDEADQRLTSLFLKWVKIKELCQIFGRNSWWITSRLKKLEFF